MNQGVTVNLMAIRTRNKKNHFLIINVTQKERERETSRIESIRCRYVDLVIVFDI